jgi:antitoxin component of MazEF toxin-antitoxin module
MKNQWSLYSWKPFKTYPSVHYFWVNSNDTIVYERSVEPLGYIPAFNLSEVVTQQMSGMKKLIEQYGDLTGIVKKVKTDMTDDELSRGILSFRKRPKRVENDPTLEEMLSTITDDNRQELVDWGKDVGREVIED